MVRSFAEGEFRSEGVIYAPPPPDPRSPAARSAALPPIGRSGCRPSSPRPSAPTRPPRRRCRSAAPLGRFLRHLSHGTPLTLITHSRRACPRFLPGVLRSVY